MSLLALSLVPHLFTPIQAETAKEISVKIGKLRAIPDSVRAKVTKELAIQIRTLSGEAKTGLAMSLANLATEGDFGTDTLQEVATTLELALGENQNTRYIESGYSSLAQLVRYEHVKVKTEAPAFKKAMEIFVQTDKARAAADFTLNDITGKTWTLSALRGKVVLVNFWATWCPPCKKEMPDLEALSKRFKDLVVLAISDETMDKVKPFIAEKGYTYPVLLDPGRKVNELYRVDGIPKSFIYNREGQLVAQAIDMRTMGQFEKLLKQADLSR